MVFGLHCLKMLLYFYSLKFYGANHKQLITLVFWGFWQRLPLWDHLICSWKVFNFIEWKSDYQSLDTTSWMPSTEQRWPFSSDLVVLWRSQVRGQPRGEASPGEEVVAMQAPPPLQHQLPAAVQPEEEEEGYREEDTRGDAPLWVTQLSTLGFEQPEFDLTLKYIQMKVLCRLNFNIKYSMPFKIQDIMALICFHTLRNKSLTSTRKP